MEKVVAEVELTSGYIIGVSTLPPYYMDLINDRFPLPDYPVRKITLAGGDSIDWPYEPPEETPSEDDEDYELFVKWHDVHRKRNALNSKRNQARVNYLLSMCVEVIDGPIAYDDVETWGSKLKIAFPGFEIPDNAGERHLLFLKHFAITTTEELNMIIGSSTSPEVTMQGISAALQGFRNILEAGGIGEDITKAEGRKSGSLDEAVGS